MMKECRLCGRKKKNDNELCRKCEWTIQYIRELECIRTKPQMKNFATVCNFLSQAIFETLNESPDTRYVAIFTRLLAEGQIITMGIDKPVNSDEVVH